MPSRMSQGSSPDPERGVRRLGPYEIHTGLSVGGMAELYLASLPAAGGYRKFVALKKILSDVQNQERFARMFRDEAHITAALSHKNIAQVYDLGQAEDEMYLAMEYVLGMDLARLLRVCKKRNEPMPMGLAARVVRDVCAALDYAHRFVDLEGQPAPIVHRDITPKNLMLGFDGQVKVIDFGVALAKNKLEVTATGTIKGTAAYMSPEQVRAKRLDGRSDLYSAGAVLFELLTGRRVFEAKQEVELFKQILSAPVPPVRQFNPAVPEGLAQVVEQALSRDPSNRFETGMKMAEAIHGTTRGLIFDTDKTRDFMMACCSDKLNEARAVLKLAQDEDDQQRPEGQRRGPNEVTAPQRGQAVALVVEANPGRLQKLQAAFQVRDLRLEACASAAEALESLKTITPDIVLIATQLGKSSGFELCRLLREAQIRPHLPVLLMSQECSLDERAEGLRAGGDDFVRLPFDPGEIAGRIRGHLIRATLMRDLLSPKRDTPVPKKGRVP